MSCSICSIWSVVDASVSKPGITTLAGSGLGFHRGGFGGIGLEESDMKVSGTLMSDAPDA